DHGVEADAEEAPDLAGVDLAEHLVAIDARPRKVIGGHAPDPGHVGSMFRVPEIPHSWELVALLAVLAPALAVRLAGDRRVAAALRADPPRGQDDVDRAEAVLDAVAVVLDAPGVEQDARLRGPPPLGGLLDGALRDARDLRGAGGRPLGHRARHLVEADRVSLDERAIEPLVLDH